MPEQSVKKPNTTTPENGRCDGEGLKSPMNVPSAHLGVYSNLKRRAILDAALDCFLELGFAATSMDGVAAAARVSKATIYAHFRRKADLFAAVIKQECDRNLFNPTAWPDSGLAAREALMKLGQHMLSQTTSPRSLALHRIVITEAFRHPDLAQAFWGAGPNHILPRVAALFEDLDRRKQLRVPNPSHAALLFANLMRTEIFFCRMLGLPDGTERITADELVFEAVEMILRAYAP